MSTKTFGRVLMQNRVGEGSDLLPAVLEYWEVPYMTPAKPLARAPPTETDVLHQWARAMPINTGGKS